MATVEATRINFRGILRRYIEEFTEGVDEVTYSELIEFAQHDLMVNDEIVLAAAEELVSVLVPEILREVMRGRRHEVVAVSSGFFSQKRVDETAIERISKVFEGTGHGGYKALFLHRKFELLDLNRRDELQMATTRKWVDFRGELAERMNDTQVVGDLNQTFITNTWNRFFVD